MFNFNSFLPGIFAFSHPGRSMCYESIIYLEMLMILSCSGSSLESFRHAVVLKVNLLFKEFPFQKKHMIILHEKEAVKIIRDLNQYRKKVKITLITF